MDQALDAVAALNRRGGYIAGVNPDMIRLTIEDGQERIVLSTAGIASVQDVLATMREQELRGQEASEQELPYVAPEVLMGRAPDPRADVFTMGVLAYQMTTGRLPYRAASLPELLGQMLQTTPVALPGIAASRSSIAAWRGTPQGAEARATPDPERDAAADVDAAGGHRPEPEVAGLGAVGVHEQFHRLGAGGAALQPRHTRAAPSLVCSKVADRRTRPAAVRELGGRTIRARTLVLDATRPNRRAGAPNAASRRCARPGRRVRPPTAPAACARRRGAAWPRPAGARRDERGVAARARRHALQHLRLLAAQHRHRGRHRLEVVEEAGAAPAPGRELGAVHRPRHVGERRGVASTGPATP